MICVRHNGDPFVVVVHPRMDTKDASFRVYRCLRNDFAREASAALLGTLFEACRHVYSLVHLARSNNVRQIKIHKFVKLLTVRVNEGLEDATTRSLEIERVEVLGRSKIVRNAFFYDLRDVIDETLTKVRVRLRPFSHLVWRSDTFNPQLYTSVSYQ